MASLHFDPEDYLDEVSTSDLVEELLRRRDSKRDRFRPAEVGIVDRQKNEELLRDLMAEFERGGAELLLWRMRRELQRIETREEPIEVRFAALKQSTARMGNHG